MLHTVDNIGLLLAILGLPDFHKKSFNAKNQGGLRACAAVPVVCHCSPWLLPSTRSSRGNSTRGNTRSSRSNSTRQQPCTRHQPWPWGCRRLAAPAPTWTAPCPPNIRSWCYYPRIFTRAWRWSRRWPGRNVNARWSPWCVGEQKPKRPRACGFFVAAPVCTWSMHACKALDGRSATAKRCSSTRSFLRHMAPGACLLCHLRYLNPRWARFHPSPRCR